MAAAHSDGFTAGGQVGCNYQFGAGNGVVIGLEADAAYTDLGQNNVVVLPKPFVAGTSRNSVVHSDMDVLGTVRGRLGYAFDRVLVYGTGGLAYGDVTERANFFNAAGALSYTGSRSSVDVGYAYGGGIEYAVPTDSFVSALNVFHSSAVTVKAEFLHYDLGTASALVAATGAGVPPSTGAYTQRIHTDGNLVRIGLNYKF